MKSPRGLRSAGASLVEAAVVLPVLALLVLGLVQLALIGQAMFVLNEAAHMAARAAAASESEARVSAASAWVVGRTLGLNSAQGTFGGVSQQAREIPGHRPSGVRTTQQRVETVAVTVTYWYRPLWRSTATGGRLRLVATCRFLREPAVPRPGGHA